MYSTGNYIQCFIITYKEKESEKEYICLNHCAVCLKLTQHCKSTMGFFFFLSFKVGKKKKKISLFIGHLKNYFHFPKCFLEHSLVGGEPGCKEVTGH